jgi:membrane protease YdiL (CAAX protease family)
MVIVGVTALIVYSNANAAGAKDGILVQSATARFRAMILIATKSMERRFGVARDQRLDSQFSVMIRQVEQEARTAEDKFHAAIVAGEVIGKERALMVLEGIGPEGNTELANDIAAARMIYADGPQSLTPELRQRLIHRHGDFGKMVLAFGVGPGEEPRKSIEDSALRSLIMASFVGLAVMLLAVLSIAFCILGAIFQLRKKIQPAYVAAPSSDSRFLEAFAVYLIVLIGLGALLRFFGLRTLGWNWVVLIVPATLLLWIGMRRGSIQEVLHAVGWHRGRGWWREIAAGLTAYVGGLVLVVPGIVITYLLIRATGSNASHPIMTPLLAGDRWHLLGLYGLACIVAPATEETMFRGILFHHLRSRWSWFLSAGIVSLVFAILHPQGWAAVPALGAIALVLSGIREWRDSLIGSLAAHSFNNFLALTFALLLLR